MFVGNQYICSKNVVKVSNHKSKSKSNYSFNNYNYRLIIYADNLCNQTKGFKNHNTYDSEINPNLANAINEVWGRKVTSEKLKWS